MQKIITLFLFLSLFSCTSKEDKVKDLIGNTSISFSGLNKIMDVEKLKMVLTIIILLTGGLLSLLLNGLDNFNEITIFVVGNRYRNLFYFVLLKSQ